MVEVLSRNIQGLMYVMVISVLASGCKNGNEDIVKEFGDIVVSVSEVTSQMNAKYNNDQLMRDNIILQMRITNASGSSSILDYTTECSKTRKEKENYFNFDMKKDMWIASPGGDSIPISYVQFDNSPFSANYSDFLISIKDKRVSSLSEYKLIWNDNIFCNGIMKFRLTNNSK